MVAPRAPSGKRRENPRARPLTARRAFATIPPMNFRLPRFRSTRAMHTAVLACAPLLVTFTCSQFDVVASAQNAPAAKPTGSKTSTFTATINTDGTLVRSAPNNETGYPFGSLSKGQTVTVVETQPGWVRVRTEGTSFEGWGGYVPALPGVALSADGKTIKITGTAPINAPNGTAEFNPDRSWKAIGYLTTGDELPVLETIKGERDTFYAVPLGGKTSGWIADSAITTTGGNAPKTPEVATPNTGTTTTTTGTATGTNTDGATADNNTTATSTTTSTTTDGTTDGTTTTGTDNTNGTGNSNTGTDNTTVAKKPVPKAVPPATPTAAQLARAKFNEVEAKWQTIAKNECSMQDLEEIREGFLAVNRDATALSTTRKNALSRSIAVAQLMELRTLKARANEVAQRAQMQKQEVVDLEKWLLARQQYTAIGVLNASVVYDGERLPRLYRLQDPVSGHTTAYLMEDPELKLSSMLGLVVGVKGGEAFDESLRRNIITPKTVAVLQTGGETEIASPAKVGGGASDENGSK